MEYLEHLIIFLIFGLALRYLFRVFFGDKATGCSKSCGNKCAVANLDKVIKEFEKDWKEQ
ncbi:hypothetical protein [Aureispira anguillae]|uniref:FeoB-associated Cys-rich membrane protein n=1 Tax=Aureispira anguillae TaxID=2864201 RepID=A0A915YI07_9BACT|nr:hypothetical protein [Aureispira anguillae]BDS13372.1 hypothetical protein AsAng_0041090 [Aureispira anguillae]